MDGLTFGADIPEAGRDALPPRAEFQRVDAATEGRAEDQIRRGQHWLAPVDEPPEEALAVLQDALEDEEPLVLERSVR